MRLLLDTHILLWCLTDDDKLGKEARRLIENAADVYVSAASYWELAIKIAAGKFAADLAEIRRTAADDGYIELPVSGEHVQTTLILPPHHKDPFDRLIVAAAIAEPMRLLTADSVLVQYSELVHLM